MKEAAKQTAFPAHFEEYLDVDVGLYVSPVLTMADMIEAGMHLDNCLASIPKTFAAHALAGSRLYAVTRRSVVNKSKLSPSDKPLTAVELERTDGKWLVRQHYGPRNNAPSAKASAAVAGLLSKLNEAQQ